MRWLAKVVNIYTRFLPMPPFGVLLLERRLWRRPFAIKEFLTTIRPEALWQAAEVKLLQLVPSFVVRTPALRELQKRYFPGRRLSTLKEFQTYFPILDKESYVKRNAIADLAVGGRLPRAGSFYTSAGTTGKPTIWIESAEEQALFENAVTYIADLMVDIRRREYIVLNCWALGTWPTGIDFFTAIRHWAKVANVGTNVSAAVEVLKAMGPGFPYVIAGYPPFVFHLFEECAAQGIDLAQYEIDIVTGGEGFVEEWRDVLVQKLGPERAIFSVYGSTDMGLGEGIETNLAYALRTLLYIAQIIVRERGEEKAREMMQLRFGTGELPFKNAEEAKAFLLGFLKEDELKRLPMVFQFNPLDFYTENLSVLDPVQGRHVREFVSTMLSPATPVPRVRYNIHDEGFVMTYGEVVAILAHCGVAPATYNPRHDAFIDLHLPFLFVFGRSDGTISIDGANIFPEDIARCLHADAKLAEHVASFQLFVSPEYRFGIAIELKEGIEATHELREGLRDYFRARLAAFSLGYQEIEKERLPSAKIELELYPPGEGPFAAAGIKSHYVRR